MQPQQPLSNRLGRSGLSLSINVGLIWPTTRTVTPRYGLESTNKQRRLVALGKLQECEKAPLGRHIISLPPTFPPSAHRESAAHEATFELGVLTFNIPSIGPLEHRNVMSRPAAKLVTSCGTPYTKHISCHPSVRWGRVFAGC